MPSWTARTQRLQDQSMGRVQVKTTGKVDGHRDFGVRRETPRRCAPMGRSLAPVRVAGFTWNGWKPSAVYATRRRHALPEMPFHSPGLQLRHWLSMARRHEV